MIGDLNFMNFIYISPNFPEKHWLFCKSLKERGFNVLGIGDTPYNSLAQHQQLSMTEYYYCNLSNIDELKKAAQYYQDKYGVIDFIESNNEYWLVTDAKLRDAFHVTSGFSEKEITYLQSKINMKTFFEKAGSKYSRYIIPTTLAKSKKFVELTGYPVFVKPTAGVGAVNSYKINNDKELSTFIKDNKEHLPNYVMEEFIQGELNSFDGVVDKDGKIIFCDQEVFPNSIADVVNADSDIYYYCKPSPDPKLIEIGSKIVKEFNIKQRFFHLEFFKLTVEKQQLGKVGDYIPLEINLRPPGGNSTDLICISQSKSVYDIYSYAMAGVNLPELKEYAKYYAFATSRKNGFKYKNDVNNLLFLYNNNVNYTFSYPAVIAKAMGDYVVYSHFDKFEDGLKFDKLFREKNE
jgi:hypothetical protein